MNKKQIFEVREDGFFLDGEPFYLASGDIHYFRIHQSGWRRRLELMKDFGLTAVETYCPWNVHEPREGEFDFEGMNDLAAFLELCAELDLKVLLRPAPYICSEFELGGIPSWLLRDKDMIFRKNHEKWLAPMRRYYKVLCDVFRPYLCTNGGPIIMVAVENEYGFLGDDRSYMEAVKKIMADNGVDVPFFTTDPYGNAGIINGSMDGLLEGVNFRSIPENVDKSLDCLATYHGGFPLYVGEFWSGRQIHWGRTYQKRDPKLTAEAYKKTLERGAYVNFYMFCGGTNWGFYNGAVEIVPVGAPAGTPKMYIPQATSYDENSLVSENGEPIETYFLCRDVLDDYLGKPRRPHVAPAYETQSIDVTLTEYATLWDNIDELAATKTVEVAPRHMEDFGQDFGYILYSFNFDKLGDENETTIKAKAVKDFAAVYKDEKYIDYWFRDRKRCESWMSIENEHTKISVLVENMGRRNQGPNLEDNRKGIDGYFVMDQAEPHNIETVTLPMKDLSKLKYKEASDDILGDTPMFLRGKFDAKEGIDTFFSMDGFDHGFVRVNGFNVGRFLPMGPQRTLYIPGGLLKERDNVIEIFDLSPKALTAHLVKEASLEMEIDEGVSQSGGETMLDFNEMNRIKK